MTGGVKIKIKSQVLGNGVAVVCVLHRGGKVFELDCERGEPVVALDVSIRCGDCRSP